MPKNARKDISTEYENLIQKIFFFFYFSKFPDEVLCYLIRLSVSCQIFNCIQIYYLVNIYTTPKSSQFNAQPTCAQKCYYMLVNCWKTRLTVLDLVLNCFGTSYSCFLASQSLNKTATRWSYQLMVVSMVSQPRQ